MNGQTGGQTERQLDKHNGQMDGQTGRQMDKQTDYIQNDWLTYGETDRQMDLIQPEIGQVDGCTDGQTNRLTDHQNEVPTDTLTFKT